MYYHDNYEVEPAPSVREVFLEAKGKPFDQHLDEEYDGEDTIHIIQDVLKNRPMW